MFRKLWKTLKYFVLLAAVLICLPHSILPSQSGKGDVYSFEYYAALNEKEQRLPEYKDTEEILRMKLAQLEIINKSRKRYNASELKLEIFASRVANKMAREAAENNYSGHWNLAGEKPYQRYGLAGGYDHVAENAYSFWSSENLDNSTDYIAKLMKDGHDSFMSEKSPNDGHKKNIIQKSHNFVGLGYFLSGKQFRYYEEFIDKYFDFQNIPAEVKVNKQFTITVDSKGESFLYFLTVYRDDFPSPLTPQQLNRKGSYEDYTKDEIIKMPAWDLAALRNGNIYRIPLSFPEEGLYYIHIYYDKRELVKNSSITTKGKYPASGIIIKATR